MFRYRVTPKFQSPLSLQWFIWARDEAEARMKLCDILNSRPIHNAPRWVATEFVAEVAERVTVND